MTADAGLIARLHNEIDTAGDAAACRCAGEHLFDCYFRALLSEPEYDALFAELVQRRRAITAPALVEVWTAVGDAVETALQLAGQGVPAVPADDEPEVSA